MNVNSATKPWSSTVSSFGKIGKWALRVASLAGLVIALYSVFYFLKFVGSRGTLAEYFWLPFPSLYLAFSFVATFIRRTKVLIVTAIILNSMLVAEEIWARIEDSGNIGFGLRGSFVFIALWTLFSSGRLGSSGAERKAASQN